MQTSPLKGSRSHSDFDGTRSGGWASPAPMQKSRAESGYVVGSSYEVIGAGDCAGTYTRTAQQCFGVDVYRKPESSHVLMRKGEEGWSLVDVRGSTVFRWSLRATELYFCPRKPPGAAPPLMGWGRVEGEGPPPMLKPGKSPLLPFLMQPPDISEDKADLVDLFAPTTRRKKKEYKKASLMLKCSSEPRMPRSTKSKDHFGDTSFDFEGDPTMSSTHGSKRSATRPRLPNGMIRYQRSWRVVLSRPSARTPWGFKWNSESYTENGQRILSSILPKSPLERWNVWQQISGRPELCVLEGDQLIKCDGRWAYYEEEVSIQDSRQARSAIRLLEDAEGSDKNLVLEFIREAIRPAPPNRPRVEVWETQASLVVTWDPPPEGMVPYQQVWGWAVCLYDMDNDLWYVVDGASWVAKPLNLLGKDVGVANPDTNTMYVSDGIAFGRAYAACVAMLTDTGWSAYSALSRSSTLRPSARISDDILGLDPQPDSWPQRLRYAAPCELLPGISSPIDLRPGPRDLMHQQRWLKLKAVLDCSAEGLKLVKRGKVLMIDQVVPGSPVDNWNQQQVEEDIHGFTLRKYLQRGDVISEVNGLHGAVAMLTELQKRKPPLLVMTVERLCGGSSAHPGQAVLFEYDDLDADASQVVEELHWHVLISEAEATASTTMLGSNCNLLMQALSMATEAVASKEVSLVNPKILEDAERRMILTKRLQQIIGKSGSRPMTQESTRSGEPVAIVNSNDERSLIALRTAMAHVDQDEEKLHINTSEFQQSSKVVRGSQAGLDLIERAQSLEELWKWRRRCAQIRDEIREVIRAAVEHEAKVQDEHGEFRDFSIKDPLHNLNPLRRITEAAEKYKSELHQETGVSEMILLRLVASNTRYSAEKRILTAMTDPRQDQYSLESALDHGEELGVQSGFIKKGRKKVEEWKIINLKASLHDELFQAVKALRKHVDDRKKPGAGATEQRRMRIAIIGSGLPSDDPLVAEAWDLLRHWEQDNVALRAEARLASAIHRVEGGFNPDYPEAGDLLGSAIAEVAQQGVDAKFLDAARSNLAVWQKSRLKIAAEELELATRYNDEDFLKSTLDLAKIAGIDEETIDIATKILERLRMEDEVKNAMMKAMEETHMDNLGLCIQLAHTSFFLEDEMDLLRSGSLQWRLRYWAQELQSAVQSRSCDGLDRSVKSAQVVLAKSQEACVDLKARSLGANGVPEVAVRTLERDIRSLLMVLPEAKDMADVHLQTLELQRILGAVERYASQLPKVIANAKSLISKGIDEDLVNEAVKALAEYDATVKAIQDGLVEFQDDSTSVANARKLKDAAVQARLAGAPISLVDEAFKQLDEMFPDIHTYGQVQVELLVAKQEADDIQELSAAGRFLRLQDAADAAKRLTPKLDANILAEVSDISMALAAERSFVMAVTDAKAVLNGAPMSAPDVIKCGVRLLNAIKACETTAQEEAKKAIPEAEDLRHLLIDEEQKRQKALDQVIVATGNARVSPMYDLVKAIVVAREACVPAKLLEEAYASLRKKKLDFVTNGLRTACNAGKHALAHGLYQRGLALKVSEERNGGDWRNGSIENEITNLRSDVQVVDGEFTVINCGGSFGTNTWRKNPCYIIKPVNKAGKGAGGARGSDSSIKLSVVVAEAGESPASLAVHVVRNSEQAIAAGCGNMLVPGFEVLAASDAKKDMPDCEFEISSMFAGAPTFIVPSSARSEVGPFKLIISSSEPVEIVEVPNELREPRLFYQTFDVKWTNERPYWLNMGGPRGKVKAPPLMWYHNPQFRVSIGNSETGGAHQTEANLRGLSAKSASSSKQDSDRRSKSASKQTIETESDEVWDIMEDKDEGDDIFAEDKLRIIFDACDVQGNGLISHKELLKAAKKDPDIADFFNLPSQIRLEDGSLNRAEAMFQAMDEDGDNEINFAEFLLFQKRCKAGDFDDIAEDGTSSAASGWTDRSPQVLLVVLKPSSIDGLDEAAPAAIHGVRNRDGFDQDFFVNENPSNHELVTTSGSYSAASEVGAAVKLRYHAKPLVIVPSLSSKSGRGSFTITFMSTTELKVERLQ